MHVSAVKRLADWLDDRTGYRGVVRGALDERVLGGASFAYVFGSVLTFILILQITTGIFLAMYYSPSSTDAWASVAYIQDSVTLGWFVRGLHSHGASAMVIVAGLHLMQTAIWGAYKAPREMNWILGVLMLGLILAFALTGYLLPWDQTGYWATKVATGIAGTSPLIGEPLQRVIQGGNEYGNLTLTRFFAIHAFVLPALLLGLVVAHIALFRRHGVTPSWRKSKEQLDEDVQPFWPDQMFRDMVAAVAVLAILAGVTIYTGGVKLDSPADPSSAFDARPEWYFRFLFQALKYFHGPMETVVALGMPVVLGGFLLALPFVDRGADRNPKARLVYLGLLAGIAAVVVGLTVVSYVEDSGDERLQDRLEVERAMSAEARALARDRGVPTAGGTTVWSTQPHYEGRRLWVQHCQGCHEGAEREAPEIIAGYNDRAWIEGFLRDPSGDRYFGRTGIDEMEAVEAGDDDMAALVELVYAQTGAEDADPKLVARGEELFDGGECLDCHYRTGTDSGDGPNINRRGSLEWLAAFVRDPGAPRFFGEYNEMPAFHDELSFYERGHIAEYLVWLRTATPEEVAAIVLPEEIGGDEDEDDGADGESE